MRASTLSLAVLALVAVALPVRADDAAVQRAKSAMAALPAPSKEKAFDWELDLLFNGAPVGTARVRAEPEGEGDQAGWKCTAEMNVPSLKITSSEFAKRDLTTVEGEEKKVAANGTKEATWERTDAGYTVKTQQGGAESSQDVSLPGGAVKGLSTFFLFCRMIPAEAATYEVTTLNVIPDDDEKSVEVARLIVKGAGKWEWDGKTVDAWVVRLEEGDKTGNLYFHPTTRALLGIKFDQQPIVMLPKGVVKKGSGPDFSQPAKTAKMAATRAALAFATADFEILDDVVHWETAAERASVAHGETVDAEALKAGLKQNLPKQAERSAVEPMLAALVESLEEAKQENGDTLVTFPPEFQSLKLKVREFDGVWKLVEFPSP